MIFETSFEPDIIGKKENTLSTTKARLILPTPFILWWMWMWPPDPQSGTRISLSPASTGFQTSVQPFMAALPSGYLDGRLASSRPVGWRWLVVRGDGTRGRGGGVVGGGAGGLPPSLGVIQLLVTLVWIPPSETHKEKLCVHA